MGLIYVPQSRLVKPASVLDVDRNLAAKSGTIWLSVANTGLLLHDLIGGRNIASPGSLAASTEGPAIAYNGSQQTNLAFTLPGGTTADNYVIAARIRATATQAGSPGAAFGLYNSNAVQTGIGVGFDTANAVGSAYLHGNGAGLAARSAGSLNTWYTVFVAANLLGGANYAHRAWINGTAATTDQGGTQVGGVSALDEIAVGAQHRSAGFLRQFTGQIAWASILYLPNGNGSFTDDSARQLFRSGYPYNLFSRRIWVPVSAGGGGGAINLAGAACTQAATSSTGAITQAHALTGAGSSQAATSSAGAITQSQVLAGANSSQAATSSTGAITQAYALTGSSSTQAATGSAGAISQIHQLVGANSTQASTSGTGAISLGVAINLAGAACAQASTSSAAAITQAHQLAAAACAQAATSSAAAVSQVHALVAAACAQASISGTGAISLGVITAPVAPGARIWVPPDESRLLTGSSERRVWAAPAESRTLKAEP